MNLFNLFNDGTMTWEDLRTLPEVQQLLQGDPEKMSIVLFDASGNPKITTRTASEDTRDLLYSYLNDGQYGRAHRLLGKYEPAEINTRLDFLSNLIVAVSISKLDRLTGLYARGGMITRELLKEFTHDWGIDEYESAVDRLTEGKLTPEALIHDRCGEDSLEYQTYVIMWIIRKNNEIRLSRGSAYREEGVSVDSILKDAASRALQHRRDYFDFG